MPVYHFTLHAYRSWSADNPRGYVRRRTGILRPDPQKAAQYDSQAKWPPVRFTTQMQQILVLGSYDVCQTRGWRLHMAAAEPSHLHLIVSWRQYLPWQKVRQRIKNVLSLSLGRAASQAGRQWFVREASRKRVTDREHLDHLTNSYLPKHRGLLWREGQPLPEDRWGILGGRRAAPAARGLPSAATKSKKT